MSWKFEVNIHAQAFFPGIRQINFVQGIATGYNTLPVKPLLKYADLANNPTLAGWQLC